MEIGEITPADSLLLEHMLRLMDALGNNDGKVELREATAILWELSWISRDTEGIKNEFDRMVDENGDGVYTMDEWNFLAADICN